MISQEMRQERSKTRKQQEFKRFLDDPLTRIAMSSIPDEEGLKLLLSAAFDSGFKCGMGDIAVDLMEAIMEFKRERK